MALCLVNNSGLLTVSTTQTEIDCTAYLLTSADEYRVSHGFFSGVEMVDVITVSWLVVMVWAAAWSVKVMRGR